MHLNTEKRVFDHCFIRGYTEATQAMVSAMREAGVRRLVLCHSWYTEEASRGQAMFLIRSVSGSGVLFSINHGQVVPPSHDWPSPQQHEGDGDLAGK